MRPSLESFQRQFILTQVDGPAPSNFIADDFGDWRLLTHPQLGRFRVCDRDGRRLGWLLGEAIDVANRAFIAGDVRLDLTLEGEGPAALSRIAEIVKEWAGWYLLVLAHPRLDCLMTDSGARLPCFFDETTGTVASCPALIMGIDAYERELRRDLLAAVNIDGKGWLPFGLTAIPHIRRVLPRHRLRLGDLTVERVWPARPIAVDTEHGHLVEAIARRMKAVIDIVIEPDGALLPLTAGHESRMLLALSRAHASRLRAFTLMNPRAEVDHKVARQVAAIAGIPHQTLTRIRSSEDERQAWLMRTGHVVGDENPRHFNTLRSLDTRLPVLSGVGGWRPLPASYWRGDTCTDRTISPCSLLRRLDMPQHPMLLEAAKCWLQSVDQFDLPGKLDLAYIELRLGCWGASPPFGPSFIYRDYCPFVQTTVIELTLALPREFRRDKRLGYEIIAREWPELLRLPFNRLPGMGHYVFVVKKAADPDRVRRKIRLLMASV
jgi:hypothetical protein